MAIPLRKVIDYKFYDNITYNEIPCYQPLPSTTLYNSLKNSLLILSSLFIKNFIVKIFKYKLKWLYFSVNLIFVYLYFKKIKMPQASYKLL